MHHNSGLYFPGLVPYVSSFVGAAWFFPMGAALCLFQLLGLFTLWLGQTMPQPHYLPFLTSLLGWSLPQLWLREWQKMLGQGHQEWIWRRVKRTPAQEGDRPLFRRCSSWSQRGCLGRRRACVLAEWGAGQNWWITDFRNFPEHKFQCGVRDNQSSSVSTLWEARQWGTRHCQRVVLRVPCSQKTACNVNAMTALSLHLINLVTNWLLYRLCWANYNQFNFFLYLYIG